MKLLTIFFISLSMNIAYANIEESKVICGELSYTNGNYVLMADHEDHYFVREEKLDKESLEQTTLMRIIVSNHDYDESDYPQACFYDVQAERTGEKRLDVLKVSDVKLREVLN